MGWFSSDKGGKAAITKAQRARAIRVQERYEREERALQRAAKMERQAARAARKGSWGW